MISATRRWLRRNQNGIAITAGVAGAAYLAGQYVLGKIAEAQDRNRFDRLARENLRRRFEQNQTDCTFTVLALLPNVAENVLEALPVEQLTHELQQRKLNRLARSTGEGAISEPGSGPPSTREGDTASLSSLQSSSYVYASQLAHSDGDVDRPRKSKAQLWNEIKISSITRAFTMLYTLSLLTLLTRVQLNLLGRLNYLSSVISLTRPSAAERINSISLEDNDGPGSPGGYGIGNDFETNRRYLAFTWYLLNKGYKVILAEVQAAVTEVFGSMSPTEAISANQLSSLTVQVRQRIEGATAVDRRSKNWLSYLLPPRDDEVDLLVQSGVVAAPSAPLPLHQQHTSSPAPASQASATSVEADVIPSTSPLRNLLDETADLIESPTFIRIHSLLLDSLFSHLIEHRVIEAAFPSQQQQQQHQQQQQQQQQQFTAPSTLQPSHQAQEQDQDQQEYQQPNPHHIPEVRSAITVVPATYNTFDPPPTPTTNIITASTSTSNTPNNKPPSPSQSTPAKTKLATILAVLTRQAHCIGSTTSATNINIDINTSEPTGTDTDTGNLGFGGVGAATATATATTATETNEYVDVMEREVRELDGFAAVIFSSAGTATDTGSGGGVGITDGAIGGGAW